MVSHSPEGGVILFVMLDEMDDTSVFFSANKFVKERTTPARIQSLSQ